MTTSSPAHAEISAPIVASTNTMADPSMRSSTPVVTPAPLHSDGGMSSAACAVSTNDQALLLAVGGPLPNDNNMMPVTPQEEGGSNNIDNGGAVAIVQQLPDHALLQQKQARQMESLHHHQQQQQPQQFPSFEHTADAGVFSSGAVTANSPSAMSSPVGMPMVSTQQQVSMKQGGSISGLNQARQQQQQQQEQNHHQAQLLFLQQQQQQQQQFQQAYYTTDTNGRLVARSNSLSDRPPSVTSAPQQQHHYNAISVSNPQQQQQQQQQGENYNSLAMGADLGPGQTMQHEPPVTRAPQQQHHYNYTPVSNPQQQQQQQRGGNYNSLATGADLGPGRTMQHEPPVISAPQQQQHYNDMPVSNPKQQQGQQGGGNYNSLATGADLRPGQTMQHEQLRQAQLVQQQQLLDDEENQRLERDMDQLRREVEYLKKMKQLKEEEVKLKRWLEQQQEDGAGESIMRPPTIEQRKQGRQELNEPFEESPHAEVPQMEAKASPSNLFRRNNNNSTNQYFAQSSHSGMDTHKYDDAKSYSKKPLSPNSRRKPPARDLMMRRGRGSTSNNNNMGPTVTNSRILLRKIINAILTDLDDETLRREDTDNILIIITYIKEAILGIFVAFLMVSLLLFIDHVFVLRLPTAHTFRKATFKMMQDKETMLNLEENAGLKFVERKKYDAMVKEVALSRNKTLLGTRVLEMRTEDLKDMHTQLEQYKLLLPEWMKELNFDSFCGQCLWNRQKRVTCAQRVEALVSEHKIGKWEATQVTMLSKRSCKKSSEQREEEKRIKDVMKEEEKIMGHWDETKDDFCADCEWDADMTCHQRVTFLTERYGTPRIKGTAITMAESPKCKNSFYVEDNKKIARFCGGCQWGWNGRKRMNCMERVEFLVYTYRNPERVAKLAAMEKRECRLDG